MKKQDSFSVCHAVSVFVLGTSVAVLTTARAQGHEPEEFLAPTVFQAAGPTLASIQSRVAEYRVALKRVDNGNAGPQEGGRREINWTASARRRRDQARR